MKPTKHPESGSYGSDDGARTASLVFTKEAKCPKGQIPVRKARNPSTDDGTAQEASSGTTRKYVHQVSTLSNFTTSLSWNQMQALWSFIQQRLTLWVQCSMHTLRQPSPGLHHTREPRWWWTCGNHLWSLVTSAWHSSGWWTPACHSLLAATIGPWTPWKWGGRFTRICMATSVLGFLCTGLWVPDSDSPNFRFRAYLLLLRNLVANGVLQG